MNKYVTLILDIALLSYIIRRAGIELTVMLLDNNYQMVAIIWSWIVGYYVVSKATNIIERIIEEWKCK